MTTLYKRATPQQRRVLRIVEGAVKNAADAHRYSSLPHNFARSVAKRAAGTLTAQWPDVLAASSPSEQDVSEDVKNNPAPLLNSRSRAKRGGRHPVAPSPLPILRKRLGLMAGWARRAGRQSRADAFADALRVIASLEAEARHDC